MSKFFEETIQGLKEAIAMEKGEIPVVERKDMPALTYVAERGKDDERFGKDFSPQ